MNSIRKIIKGMQKIERVMNKNETHDVKLVVRDNISTS